VLILGSGGREHALAWKLAQSARVERLFVCPGNGGTATLPKTANVSLSGTNFEELVKFATENEVRLPLDLRDPVLILAMLGQSRCAWSGAAIGRWRGDVLP
jgi:phosphoribosylamine-glycine ligase